MSKFTGNIIRLPAVTPTQNSASGVYTLDDQFTAQSSGTWPIVRDQYFNYTTLLLTGAVQGTAYPNPVTQPYSFLSDASTNNFVVSPNGDVSARPFNPYLNSYSNYFGGSSDFLRASVSAISSSSFTVEAWVYFAGASITNATIYDFANATNGYGMYLVHTSPGNLTVQFYSNNTGTLIGQISTNFAGNYNKWVHVAVSYDGSTYRLFVGGFLVGTPVSSATQVVAINTLTVGARSDSSPTQVWLGYISNFRYVTGSALYTANFTPSISPLGIAGTGTTRLLTCQSNRFIDNSSSPLTLTVTGTPAVSQNSPFVSYDTTNGSGYFDGTGDYLITPTDAAFAFGTGDFQIEFFFFAQTTGQQRLVFFTVTDANQVSMGVFNNYEVTYYDGTNTRTIGTVAPNSWNHVAVAKISGAVTCWLNGTRTVNALTDNSNTSSNRAVYLGSTNSGTNILTGYMSNVRIIKGSTTYSGASIPVPTAPLTPVSGTSLLTLQTRAPATNNGFIDSSPNNFVVTRNGNATQGSFSPFSPTGWSNYFGGANNLSIAQTTALDLGSGNFTVEAWIYPLNFSGNQRIIAKQRASDGYGWIFRLNSSTGYIYLEVDTGGVVTSTSAPSLNTWSHVAAVRNGNVVTLYLNGGAVGSNNSYSGSPTSVSATAYIGSLAGGEYFSGYISNIRFTKGQAFASGAFTPPTSMIFNSIVGWTGTNVPTQSITGSVGVLTCQSNRFVDNSPNNFTLTPTSTLSVQAFSPFAPSQSYIPSQIGGSGYFDGTGDYLTVPDNAAFNLAGGSWTIEGWFYLTSDYSNYRPLVTKRSGGTNSYQIYANITNGYLSFYANSIYNSTTAMPRNTWCHIAAVYDGTNIVLYLNGISILNQAATITNQAVNLLIGSSSVSGEEFGGYISNVRVIKGTAVYTSNFTPPTAPLTAIPNTSLLLNFTNGGIVDATGKNNLETVGNSGVQTTQAKWSPGSIYIPKVGTDYLKSNLASTDLCAFGSGDFVIEFWLRLVALPGSGQIAIVYDSRPSGTNGAYAALYIDNATLKYYVSSADRITGSALSINTWYYIAVARASGNTRLYIDGTQQGSTYSDSTVYLNGSQRPVIGTSGNAPSTAETINGYIDDLRVTKGSARGYSGSTITVPTGPFPLG